LTGAPSYVYNIIQYSASGIYSLISASVNSNFPIGADITGNSKFGLESGHAYTVLGAYTLSDGTQLIHMRNPYSSDSSYSGAWSDNDSRWTVAFKS
jgi:Calpain family cysteine protease